MLEDFNANDPSVTSGERTYQAILQKILRGELPPGTRITRRPLSQMLGVSHIPVLEAMKRLEQDGLIEYHPHWGSVVTIPTPEKIRDMFMLREAIECQVVRLVAAQAAADQLETLAALAAELDKIPYESSDPYLYTDVHYRFHMTLADYSGSAALYRALRRNSFFWILCRQVQSRRPREPQYLNRHKFLVEVLRGGDVQKAEDTMREHVQAGYRGLLMDIDYAKAHPKAPA